MKTYMAKAEGLERKWYVIDCEGKTFGRVASQVASILKGKHKPTYTPHVDCGDHVIVINCAEAVFTGKKLDQKSYYRHSGYVGGLKETSARAMMRTNADRAMYLAIKGMVPDTTIGREAMTRLRVYKDATHKHAAQKPEVWE